MTSRVRNVPRSQSALAEAWERRTAFVKQQCEVTSAANDAKTVRLKALRLEKERQDAACPPVMAKAPRARKQIAAAE